MVLKDKGSKHKNFWRQQGKSFLKYFSSRKERTATRDAINKGDYESIPPNARMNPDNPWNWD